MEAVSIGARLASSVVVPLSQPRRDQTILRGRSPRGAVRRRWSSLLLGVARAVSPFDRADVRDPSSRHRREFAAACVLPPHAQTARCSKGGRSRDAASGRGNHPHGLKGWSPGAAAHRSPWPRNVAHRWVSPEEGVRCSTRGSRRPSVRPSAVRQTSGTAGAAGTGGVSPTAGCRAPGPWRRWCVSSPRNPARKPLISPDTAWLAAFAPALEGSPTAR